MSSLFIPVYELSRKNNQSENKCDIVFEKVKGCGGKVNRTNLYAEAVFKKSVLKKVLWKISQNSQENICAGISFLIKLNSVDLQLNQKQVFSAAVFLWNFEKSVRTPFLQNTTWRMLLIIAVSRVVKGELENETVNDDTKTKAYVPIWVRSVSSGETNSSPAENWTCFRGIRSQMFFKVGVLKNFANSLWKHLCWRHFLIKLLSWRPY